MRYCLLLIKILLGMELKIWISEHETMSKKPWKGKKKVLQFLYGMLKMPLIIQNDLGKEFVLLWSVTLPLYLGASGYNICNLVRIGKAVI